MAECYRLTSAVLRTAVRDRLIGHNPCEGVRLTRRRRKDSDDQVITQHELVAQLLPVVADRYRALVGLAGGLVCGGANAPARAGMPSTWPRASCG